MGTIGVIKCEYSTIKSFISDYYIKNNIIVDSFWETHVRESSFYKIEDDHNIIGYFAIHKETVLVLYNIFEKYRNKSQELFATAKKYESVKEALIPTGDEFFISHAIDNYTKIEKQAYFSVYTDKNPSKILNIGLQLADIEKDRETLSLCYDFLKDEIENVKKAMDEEIYIAKDGNKVIGFGVIEYQKIVEIYASIGMIVREEYRQNGYGANILNGLKNIVKAKGKIPISGCWYYNHNSKRQWKARERIQKHGY